MGQAPTALPHPPFAMPMTPPLADRPAHLHPRARANGPHYRWLRPALALAGIVGASLAWAAATLDQDRIASALGFGIDQVSLSGHRFTSDRDIFDALDLSAARSLASFDPEATGKRFEQLAWVKSAEISRVWPDQIHVRVTERSAFAIWEHDGTASLVDATGRVLGPVRPDASLALPRFTGAGANLAAAALWSTLDRHPALKGRVLRAERIGARRWTLVLNGGVHVHLPADGEATALARLAAEPQLATRLDGPAGVIDLRAPGRIAHRTEATSGAVPPKGAAP